ncbi:hypothetical protein A3D85_03065 [Candidatus Amesbacteria bacterium RIFCSPHIGHO2_02_FULL_47_9]|uniref:PABS domain-containing protein n=1 Tax=Candidatus Amesbacteria bacterium RIFCSPHIGHO2_01_FULL_48_32b TaxID=1797253 RepID=A0A1F4YCC6_9BACT|nr:MAG: hypothetical protein A2876_03720 [Candidatus Amesbacteria bacterium RIFCSPHIGHO2_01_FULL_48_32b]OGD04881.1 MAG: hypothetical protein A3D85_03065 [Candidatus Amesbacteria bacterium RIFCSPHIGHO2_02_FULL_47_9]OGD06862.1 MAG: hypothetical protein A2899_03250 [Candidatus Amesbacteria bacterium RIFCSPLOWO2_01_FULL_49_25]
MSIISQLKKQFVPEIIAKLQSKYNGTIFVKDGYGSRYIHTEVSEVTQSGGITQNLWPPVLKKIALPRKSWLILGLAGGTLAKQISTHYSPSRMVGVEIDPVMIEIGKKYFALDQVPNLEIVESDANRFVMNSKHHFDYILVDLYLGDKIPNFISDPQFLNKLSRLGSYVVFNRLFYTPAMRRSAQEFTKSLSAYFSHIRLIRSLANLLIIARAKPDDI